MDFTIPFLLAFFFSSCESTLSVQELDEASRIRCCNFPKYDMYIYCYKGKPKHIVHMWETVQLLVSLTPDKYDHFEGFSPEEVSEKFENHKTSWNFNLYLNKRNFIKLNPFNRTCIGIVSKEDYDVGLNRIRVDYWRILLFVSGVILFLSASKLSSNSIFYYLTGISVGMCASLLILIYILSRFMPKKPVMYSFLAGGWTLGLYLAQLVFDNIKTVVVEYKNYVLYYVLTTGIISFIICYRLGPVTDPRSINLIKWAMQSVGLMIMFFSSDFQEASMALSLVLLILYNLPFMFIGRSYNRVKKWWRPPKHKLLTEDEYHQQGVMETERALDDLRGYCSSPDCNQWKTVLKLKDPLRFAKFVEGCSHLDDSEVLAFHHEDIKTMESESGDDLLTDDSDRD